jgi:hypothetical protein
LKIQQKNCELNETLEKMLTNFKGIYSKSVCLNEEKLNNCDNIKMCKINVRKVNESKSKKSISKSKNELFTCVWPQCRYSSKQKVHLKEHLLLHSDKRFECDFKGCKKSFKQKYILNEHKTIHLGKKLYFFGLNVNMKLNIKLLFEDIY